MRPKLEYVPGTALPEEATNEEKTHLNVHFNLYFRCESVLKPVLQLTADAPWWIHKETPDTAALIQLIAVLLIVPFLPTCKRISR